MQVNQGWKGNRATPWLRVCKQGWVAIAATIFSAAALAVTALIYSLRARHVTSVDEDAYISLRYARNLIEGRGLVFNPGGEGVEGITNLLWTLILAGGSWVSGLELPELAVGLGILCGALVAPIAYLWSYRELAGLMSSRWATSCTALVAPLLVVIAPGFAFYSASGLEVPLFALLVTGGLCALSQAKSRAALMSGSALYWDWRR